MDNNDKELETNNNDLEREELYQVFKKENKFKKFFVKNKDDDYIKNKEQEEIYEKGYKRGQWIGVIYTALLIFGLILLFNFKSILSPLKNIDDITKKLNEINYYLNYHFLYEKDYKKINDTISLGMMVALDDKYSTYYTKEQLEKVNEETIGEYYGIGVVVIQDLTDGYLVVSKIYEGSSANGTSMEVGDKIIKVDDIDVTGYDSDEVVQLVRGKEGTQVKLTLLKPDFTLKEVSVTRKKIETELATGKMLNDKVGYIALDSFEGKAYSQFINLKEEFINKNAQGLIIDLRNNPGGNLNVLQALCDIFLDNKLVTYFEYKNGKQTKYYTRDGAWDIPVVILINQYSASAAEAFSGALHDNGVATIVGVKSYGKGVVQEIYKLSDGSAIKFTVANYYTPNGVNITGEGIVPDVIVEDDETVNDNQLDVALETIMNKINMK